MGGGVPSLKILATQLLQLVEDILTNHDRLNELMNHKAVYGTAPATQGLLIICYETRTPELDMRHFLNKYLCQY